MRSLTGNQARLVASIPKVPVTLVVLTTYTNQLFKFVQSTFYWSDRPLDYDWENTGTLRQFEPMIQAIDADFSRTMPHLPSGHSIEGELIHAFGLTLTNYQEGGTYLMETLGSKNLEFADVVVAEYLADPAANPDMAGGLGLELDAGDGHTVLYRGQLQRVKEVTHDSIVMEFETAKLEGMLPAAIAGELVADDDLGKIPAIPYGVVRRVPMQGVAVGKVSALSAPLGIDDTVAVVSDLTGFESSGVVFIGGEELTYRGKSSGVLTDLERSEPADHSAGETVSSVPSQGVTYAIGEGNSVSRVVDVWMRSPETGTLFRLTNPGVLNSSDQTSLPNHDLATVHWTSAEWTSVIHTQVAGIAEVEPHVFTDTEAGLAVASASFSTNPCQVDVSYSYSPGGRYSGGHSKGYWINGGVGPSAPATSAASSVLTPSNNDGWSTDVNRRFVSAQDEILSDGSVAASVYAPNVLECDIDGGNLPDREPSRARMKIVVNVNSVSALSYANVKVGLERKVGEEAFFQSICDGWGSSAGTGASCSLAMWDTLGLSHAAGENFYQVDLGTLTIYTRWHPNKLGRYSSLGTQSNFLANVNHLDKYYATVQFRAYGARQRNGLHATPRLDISVSSVSVEYEYYASGETLEALHDPTYSGFHGGAGVELFADIVGPVVPVVEYEYGDAGYNFNSDASTATDTWSTAGCTQVVESAELPDYFGATIHGTKFLSLGVWTTRYTLDGQSGNWSSTSPSVTLHDWTGLEDSTWVQQGFGRGPTADGGQPWLYFRIRRIEPLFGSELIAANSTIRSDFYAIDDEQWSDSTASHVTDGSADTSDIEDIINDVSATEFQVYDSHNAHANNQLYNWNNAASPYAPAGWFTGDNTISRLTTRSTSYEGLPGNQFQSPGGTNKWPKGWPFYDRDSFEYAVGDNQTSWPYDPLTGMLFVSLDSNEERLATRMLNKVTDLSQMRLTRCYVHMERWKTAVFRVGSSASDYFEFRIIPKSTLHGSAAIANVTPWQSNALLFAACQGWLTIDFTDPTNSSFPCGIDGPWANQGWHGTTGGLTSYIQPGWSLSTNPNANGGVPDSIGVDPLPDGDGLTFHDQHVYTLDGYRDADNTFYNQWSYLDNWAGPLYQQWHDDNNATRDPYGIQYSDAISDNPDILLSSHFSGPGHYLEYHSTVGTPDITQIDRFVFGGTPGKFSDLDLGLDYWYVENKSPFPLGHATTRCPDYRFYTHFLHIYTQGMQHELWDQLYPLVRPDPRGRDPSPHDHSPTGRQDFLDYEGFVPDPTSLTAGFRVTDVTPAGNYEMSLPLPGANWTTRKALRFSVLRDEFASGSLLTLNFKMVSSAGTATYSWDVATEIIPNEETTLFVNIETPSEDAHFVSDTGFDISDVDALEFSFDTGELTLGYQQAWFRNIQTNNQSNNIGMAGATSSTGSLADTVDLATADRKYRLGFMIKDPQNIGRVAVQFSNKVGNGTSNPWGTGFREIEFDPRQYADLRDGLDEQQYEVPRKLVHFIELTARDFGNVTDLHNVRSIRVLALQEIKPGTELTLFSLVPSEGTNHYSVDVGVPIQHPVDVVRHILTSRAGLSDSDIDDTSWGVALYDLPGAKVSTLLNDLGSDFYSILGRLCFEHRMQLVTEETATGTEYRLLTAKVNYSGGHPSGANFLAPGRFEAMYGFDHTKALDLQFEGVVDEDQLAHYQYSGETAHPAAVPTGFSNGWIIHRQWGDMAAVGTEAIALTIDEGGTSASRGSGFQFASQFAVSQGGSSEFQINADRYDHVRMKIKHVTPGHANSRWLGRVYFRPTTASPNSVFGVDVSGIDYYLDATEPDWTDVDADGYATAIWDFTGNPTNTTGPPKDPGGWEGIVNNLGFSFTYSVTSSKVSGGVFHVKSIAVDDGTYPVLYPGVQPGIATVTEWAELRESRRDALSIKTAHRLRYDMDRAEYGTYSSALGVDPSRLLSEHLNDSLLRDVDIVAMAAKYGIRSARDLLLNSVRDATTAIDVLSYYANELQRDSRMISIDGVPAEQGYILERGDLVYVDKPAWASSAVLCRVLEVVRATDRGLTFDLTLVEVQP